MSRMIQLNAMAALAMLLLGAAPAIGQASNGDSEKPTETRPPPPPPQERPSLRRRPPQPETAPRPAPSPTPSRQPAPKEGGEKSSYWLHLKGSDLFLG